MYPFPEERSLGGDWRSGWITHPDGPLDLHPAYPGALKQVSGDAGGCAKPRLIGTGEASLLLP